MAAGQRVLERKLEDLNGRREREKKEHEEAEKKLIDKIRNLEKLAKDKELKLSKLQKTFADLKNLAINEAKVEASEVEKQLYEEIQNMTKGKTANDSQMEITMQRALKALQTMAKQNKDYQAEVKRLKEDKFSKTAFKK